MERRKFISFLMGFLSAIPFCGLLFKKSEPQIDLSLPDEPEAEFNLATFERMKEQLNRQRIQEVTIGGKPYRAIGIIDDEILRRIVKYKKYYMIGKSGIVK